MMIGKILGALILGSLLLGFAGMVISALQDNPESIFGRVGFKMAGGALVAILIVTTLAIIGGVLSA